MDSKRNGGRLTRCSFATVVDGPAEIAAWPHDPVESIKERATRKREAERRPARWSSCPRRGFGPEPAGCEWLREGGKSSLDWTTTGSPPSPIAPTAIRRAAHSPRVSAPRFCWTRQGLVEGNRGKGPMGSRHRAQAQGTGTEGRKIPVPCALSPSYPINPTSLIAKLLRFGNAQSSSPGVAPNHLPSVAPNWAAAIVGIHTPRLLASSGPENAKVGIWP